MTYVLPWIVVLIYLKGYYDMFHTQGTVMFAVWMCIALACLLMIAFVMRKSRVASQMDNQAIEMES
jgi:NSS family neurotransmitter:Na+ symporter